MGIIGRYIIIVLACLDVEENRQIKERNYRENLAS